MTTTYLPEYPASGTDDARARSISVAHAPVDRVFRSVARSGGTFVLLVMSLIGIFLTVKAVTAVKSEGIVKFVHHPAVVARDEPLRNCRDPAVHRHDRRHRAGGLGAVVPGSCAVHHRSGERSTAFGPHRNHRPDGRGAVGHLRRLGLSYLQNHIVPFSLWLSKYFGWIPIFHVDGVENNGLSNPALYTSSSFIGGLVVGMMIVPIQTSMMREAFSRAPQGEREGAYALGATRWGMVRSVVIPYGMGGIIGGTMLGLGRALGETIALYLIISPVFDFNLHVLQNGSNSVAVTIALRYGEANPFTMSALMALGLSLFLLTMAINFTASAIIARSRSGAESEG